MSSALDWLPVAKILVGDAGAKDFAYARISCRWNET